MEFLGKAIEVNLYYTYPVCMNSGEIMFKKNKFLFQFDILKFDLTKWNTTLKHRNSKC